MQVLSILDPSYSNSASAARDWTTVLYDLRVSQVYRPVQAYDQFGVLPLHTFFSPSPFLTRSIRTFTCSPVSSTLLDQVDSRLDLVVLLSTPPAFLESYLFADLGRPPQRLLRSRSLATVDQSGDESRRE